MIYQKDDMIRLFILLAFSALIGQTTSAQQPLVRKVTLEMRDAAISSLIRELESQTSLYFYYDKIQFDSMRVNVSAKDESIDKVLDRVFANTEFRYTIVAS